jgi:3-oxoacyl-[acyl-carrier protein] reductase
VSGVDGRVALVTGAGQGIGAAVASQLASDGAKVGLLDRSGEAAEGAAAGIRELGGTAIAVQADVTSRAQLEAAVRQVAGEFGGLHILVNNAGVLRDNLLFRMTDEDWTTVLDVHLRGAFLASQLAQHYMVEARYGRIVSMSSTSALGKRGQSNYSAAKAGLQGLTRTLAIELGPFGITANAIAPGFIETAMTAATAQRLGKTLEQLRAEMLPAIPVRRSGLPADVAQAVRFFAAEESGYVTGQVLYVDGGRGLG